LLEGDAEKTAMSKSQDQKVGQYYNEKIVNKYFENDGRVILQRILGK